MDVNDVISSEVLANRNIFRDTFFSRFPLRTMSNSLALNDDVSKAYSFPTLYHDVASAVGMFYCNYDAAYSMMPHPSMKPIRMLRNRAPVVFSCYEYRHVHQMSLYNEIAMALPVLNATRVNVPILPMIASSLFCRLGYYVFSMPVTSKENQIRGNKLWGLPKIVQPIAIDVVDGICTATACDEHNNPYFTLRVPTSGKATNIDAKGLVYSMLNGKVVNSQTFFKGRYVVNNFYQTLWRPYLAPDYNYLSIGNSSSSSALRALHIEPQPLHLRYATSMDAAFDLPISS